MGYRSPRSIGAYLTLVKGEQMKQFSKDELPNPQDFNLYRKIALTQAVRIDGPFTVETREGTLSCPDGWLAVDAHDWPYPIAAEEFDKIYTEAKDE